MSDAITGNDAIDDLLAYYRFRVNEFEKEVRKLEQHLNHGSSHLLITFYCFTLQPNRSPLPTHT